MSAAGRQDMDRYNDLILNSKFPVFARASDSSRVVESANTWAHALVGTSDRIASVSPLLVISEEPNVSFILYAHIEILLVLSSSNNTLDNNFCPGLDKTISVRARERFRTGFAPLITQRLNAAAPGANLTDEDTINAFTLCAFDSVITQITSPWCGLFKSAEFIDYSQYHSIGKYYRSGFVSIPSFFVYTRPWGLKYRRFRYGNPLGPVQGTSVPSKS